MKVGDEKIDELIQVIDDYEWLEAGNNVLREFVRQWLSEVEAEQRSRIAESLLSTDDVMPAFLKKQAE